ncbi:hypothetical protein GGI11_004007, partial [Coemansia sp. RSA 2049]
MSSFQGSPPQQRGPTIPPPTTANYGLLASSANGLFSVRGLPQSTHIDKIYLNGLHLLLPFWITNESAERVSLDLVMPADGSVKFQRDNANWNAVPACSRASYVDIVKNDQGDYGEDPSCDGEGGLDEVTMECNAGIQKEFSEVFNQIDGISRLELAPRETVELVLLYVCNNPKNGAQTPVHSRRPSLGQQSSAQPASGSVSVVGSTSDLVSLGGSRSGDRQRPHYQYTSSVNGIRIQAVSDDDNQQQQSIVDHYNVSLRTSYCKSVLEVDPPTSRVYIDDCVIGKLYERVLTIRNASEIGLDWSMTVVETTDTTSLSSLQLLDNNMDPMSDGHLAAGESSQMLIRYTPQAAGESLCRFLIENKNDPANQRYWVFRARVSQRPKPRLVELLSDPDINFGDCTSGLWYNREITLKNVSESPVAMRFRVEGNTSNLKMKSSVKAKQNHSGELSAKSVNDDSHQQQHQQHHRSDNASNAAETPASSRSDGGMGDDNASEGANVSANANDTRDEASSAAENESQGQSLGAGRTAIAIAAAAAATARQEALDLDRRTHHPRSRLAASYGPQPAHFDEVLIKPGSVRTVVLSLTGKPVASASVNAGQFDRLTFTFFCEYTASTGTKQAPRPPKSTLAGDKADDRLSLPCTVNMCTPFVRVSPQLLDFGNVDVGMLKTMYMQVENVSQVAATVQCNLESKVINCVRSAIVIPPLQTRSMRVDIYPRRINARYRKQIIVRNKHNRLNDNVVEVRSVHIDQRRMAFHNMFYKTLVPQNEQNFVDFGTVSLGSRALRRINLQNLCRCAVTIGLATGSDGNSTASDDSESMVVVYTVVPLVKDGRVTQTARDIATQLPLLERQAAMHSSIEAFKEHSRAASSPKAQPRAGFARPPRDVGALPQPLLQPLPQKTRMRALPAGVFVDKAVERGHACLVPFRAGRRPSAPAQTQPLSIEYLDLPSARRRGRPAVRILEHGTVNEPLPSPQPLVEAAPRELQAPLEAEDAAATATIRRAMAILDQIISSADTVPRALFASPRAEDEYVRKQVDLHKYIDLLVESGFLQPATQLVLPPSGTGSAIVMLRACPNVCADRMAADKLQSPRFDANLYFSLIDRPSDLLPHTDSTNAAVFANSYRLPVRRFLIQAALCRTELELGQKSINVGNMQVDEASRKYLVIQNRTETPLMYAIRKTGSIASGDIQFVDNNRYGVVRGFDSRKVVFVFSPSLNGVYSEQITISNVLDPQGSRTAILKAVVRRASKFYIQSLVLEFGGRAGREADGGGGGSAEGVADPAAETLRVGQTSSDVQVLTIKNMTPKTRYLVVMPAPPGQEPAPVPALEPAQPAAPADVVLEPVFASDVAWSAASRSRQQHYDRETEEKIESLEQKIKIAVRKNRPEKIEKYRQKLAKLRGAGPAPESTASDAVAAGSAAAASTAAAGRDEVVIRRLENNRQVALTLPPHSAADIPLVVVPRVTAGGRMRGSASPDGGAEADVEALGRVVVHEEKDKDNVKVVTLRAV